MHDILVTKALHRDKRLQTATNKRWNLIFPPFSQVVLPIFFFNLLLQWEVDLLHIIHIGLFAPSHFMPELKHVMPVTKAVEYNSMVFDVGRILTQGVHGRQDFFPRVTSCTSPTSEEKPATSKSDRHTTQSATNFSFFNSVQGYITVFLGWMDSLVLLIQSLHKIYFSYIFKSNLSIGVFRRGSILPNRVDKTFRLPPSRTSSRSRSLKRAMP